MADEAVAPSAAALLALGTDDWSATLAVALPALRAVPAAELDPAVRRLLALPLGKLVAGRTRADLARQLARPAVWRRVVSTLDDDAPRPWTAAPAPAVVVEDLTPVVQRLEQQVAELRERNEGLAAKLAQLRTERAELERSLDGATARAAAAESARETLATTAEELREALAAARAALDAAGEETARAVERARRRDEAADRRRDEQLGEARRAAEVLRAELETERRRRAAAAAADGAARGGRDHGGPEVPDTGRGRRGRPSVLPDGVTAGTRRAASWLVGEGRLLLVDGYNVTRTQRPALSFADQRRWLEDAVVVLTQRRHVDATIVWDSSHGRPTRHRSGGRLTVRFTAEDVSADDELVLTVASLVGPDQPTVVVTDDVELRGRLARYNVDLLDTASFSWLL